MISDKQLELLNSYKDKCFISPVLCEQSTNHYSFIKNIIISCGRAAFFDHTVRSALSPPHTSRAPGAATQA